jgi:hypothetical protein
VALRVMMAVLPPALGAACCRRNESDGAVFDAIRRLIG